MKRRIMSLLLVVVMLVLALSGCAYSYAKDDMTEYATFDKEAFLAALQDLKITETGDGVFTTDEATNDKHVEDAIYEALAKVVDADNKLTAGAPGAHDVLYYVYYCTGVKDDVTYTFYADKMKESGAGKIQLGLSDHEGVNAKIAEAIAALGDIDSYVYKTKTDGEAAAGDTVYVTYTRKYEKTVDEGGKETVTETYTNVVLTLGTTSGTEFKDKLVGLEIGKKKDKLDATISEVINGETVDVTYSGITINWVVESGANIPTFTYTNTASTKVSPAEPYTEDSGKIDLKDIELTYYVFPVYYNTLPVYTAYTLLTEVYGSSLSTSSLHMFSTDKYSEKIAELASLLKTLADLEKAETTAKETYEKKQAAIDTAGGEDKATAAQKTARDNAYTDYVVAQGEVEDKQKEVDKQIAAVYAIEDDVEGKIIEAYEKSIRKNLKDKYDTYIKYSLATEIYKLIEEHTTVTALPKKAVNNAYDALMDSYKESFYTGTDSSSSSTSQSYYSKYNGSFKDFLMAETNTTTYNDAKAAVKTEAEDAVKPIVQIYAAAQALDLVYTDKEYKDTIKNTNLGTYEDYYGESNIKAAEQIDKILDYYLEIDEEYLVEDEEHVDDGHDHEPEKIITYKDGKIPYTRIKYFIKADEAETE